jgi:cytochrome P450
MNSEKLSLEDIEEEFDTFMFGDHDTTAATMKFCCYLVGYHPDVQAKIHVEMNSIFGLVVPR